MTDETKEQLLERLAESPEAAQRVRSLDERLQRLGVANRRGYRLASPLSDAVPAETERTLENAVQPDAAQISFESSRR